MKKILAVDNNLVILKFMTNLLTKKGYEVMTAEDSLSALEILKTYIPYVIFVDLVMPNIDGKRLCKIIRGKKELRDVYLIILSAITAEQEIDVSEFGANACIAKGPFNEMAGHVLTALDQLDKGASRGFSEKTIGFQDISQREITKELLSYKRHSDAIFDNMYEGILELTIDGKIIYANTTAVSLIGTLEENLLASNFTELFQEPHYKRIKEILDLIDDMPQAISEDSPVILNSKQVSLKILPIVDGDRESIIVILDDITEKKRIEAQLRQAQKMEAIGTLAGGIAHDFNNMLTSVLGNISIAQTEAKPGSKIFELLTEAKNAAMRAKDLTARLITFSKGGDPFKQEVSIGEFVKDSVSSALSGSDIDSEFTIPDDLWPVEIDERQMKQVIHNIVINAQEAMSTCADGAAGRSGQGTIKINCQNIDIGEKDGLTLKAGKYVKISIADQGGGIPEENLSKIFDPYFSTKEMGTDKGMGLGLAVSHSIVKKHGGLITGDSKVDVGTTINIYLPVINAEIKAQRAEIDHVDDKSSIVNSQYSIKRVLVMDDEEMVRNVTAAMLNKFGYEVELAVEGSEAIEMYKKAKESGQPYDGVILDLTNKIGMGGVEAIKKLLEIDPKIKAIVATGYSTDPIVTKFREYGFRGALTKPFTMDELNKTVKKVLEKN